MTFSDPKLSVVLPVHNLQDSLTQQISELFEVMPDLTPNLEILIIDDGSTDQTLEVAHELAICYPQLRVIHHREHRGGEAVIRAGHEHTTGDVVIIQPENTILKLGDLLRLWELRGEQGVVVARTEPRPVPAGNLKRSKRAASRFDSRQDDVPTVQMTRRDAVEQLADAEHAAVTAQTHPPSTTTSPAIVPRFAVRRDEATI